MMPSRRCAILGASGLVSQRLQQRLANHPWFDLAAVVGSSNSAGKRLSELPWRLDEERPELPEIRVIYGGDADLISQLEKQKTQFVFSALPRVIAATMEETLARAGFHVFSNSSHHRCSDGVPLVIADLNPNHMLLYRNQSFHEDFLADQYHDGTRRNGSLACSTNCTVIPVALPLKSLWDMVGFSHVSVRTEQALSGGGWKMLTDASAQNGDFNSEIEGEAEKVAGELRHVLGRVHVDRVVPGNFTTDVTCQRVGERDGHLVEVEVHLSREVELEEVKEWMQSMSNRPQHLDLPSAPIHPVVIIDSIPNRIEHLWVGSEMSPADGAHHDPAQDLKAGMSVAVGGMTMVSEKILRFTALSHNTIRGAAGGCILLAELALAEGVICD
jgi:aspartate-semialdehyde dehydrogenase